MGYYDRDDVGHDSVAPGIAEPGALSTATRITALFVRLVGVALLLVGVWVGVKVVLAAWDLYQDPGRIERFATLVEHGSHIDAVLGTARPPAGAGAKSGQQNAPGAALEPQSSANPGAGGPGSTQDFRLSYFIAWVIVLVLLLVMSRIAVWVIHTGGELALYDMQLRRLVRQITKSERRR